MVLAPGSRLGPYEVIAMIGKGGMGEVYRAHDARLRRDVAIKSSSQPFGERFEREAQAIAALNHPNICQIYDVGPDYLVMELVEGKTLHERLEQGGALPLGEVLRYADQIAEALGAAHAKGITHRDLKPGNIVVMEDGTLKVLDFGLAKRAESGAPDKDSADSPTQSLGFTQAGVILGTAAYMSPEQARGRPVDSRSDVWSFGVVVYEMLTGRRLFEGEDLTDILASIVKDVPDLAAVPPALRPLLEACLHKDRKQRLQAIGDRHFLLREPASRAPRPRPTACLWPAISGALGLAVAALGWMHLREPPAAIRSLRYQLTRAGESGFDYFQLSPDGRYLAFVAASANDASPVARLHVRALDSLDEKVLAGTDGSSYPFWSPDSTRIAFFAEGKLKQVAVIGGPATTLGDAPDARGGAWGANDTIIFTPAVTGTLSRISASGGPATPLSLPRVGEGVRDSLRFPAFLGASDRFFYTIEADKREGEGVYLGSLRGDPPVRILPDLSTTRFVAVPGSKRSGHLLFLRAKTLMAQPFDAAQLKATGEAFPLAEGVLNSGHNGFADFSASEDGLLIYATGNLASQERELVWLARDGARGKSLLKQKGIADFELAPDRTQLAYSLATQRVAGDLWLLDVARGASRRFTFGPFSAFSPLWSPDGRELLFTAYPEDRLFKKATDATREQPLPVTGTNTYATSWSSNGELIAFSQSGATSTDDLWLWPLEGEGQPRLFKQTPYRETGAQISPDGRWLAYRSNASGRGEVHVESIAPGGAQHQISVDGGSDPRWRDDGRELYFVSGNRQMMAVEVRPGPEPTFGVPKALFREPGLTVGIFRASYQPNAEGSEFLALLSTRAATALPLTVVTNWQGAYVE